jgi:hypothetical protein
MFKGTVQQDADALLHLLQGNFLLIVRESLRKFKNLLRPFFTQTIVKNMGLKSGIRDPVPF